MFKTNAFDNTPIIIVNTFTHTVHFNAIVYLKMKGNVIIKVKGLPWKINHLTPYSVSRTMLEFKLHWDKDPCLK